MSTHEPVSHPAGLRSSGRRVGPGAPTGLGDSPTSALDGPGSTRVSSPLMQDAVRAGGLDVGPSKVPGTFAGKIAPFANPFLDGKEEALVVDSRGRLTYLRRGDTETGWQQELVTGGGTEPLEAREVVVVVHPRDLTVWAVYTGAYELVQTSALQLTATTTAGKTTCTWKAVPDSVQFLAPGVFPLSQLSVYYDDTRVPWITGYESLSRRVVAIQAVIPRDYVPAPNLRFQLRPPGQQLPVGWQVNELAAGWILRPDWSPICYLRVNGNQLVRFIPGSKDAPVTIATNLAQIVGVYRSYDNSDPEIDCVYLDTAGNLVTYHKVSSSKHETKTPGLGFAAADCWVDANRMAHIYGLDSAQTLKVLHQVSWDILGGPVWAASVTTTGKKVAACVGLVPHVAAYTLDPFPDTLPSQLVKRSGTTEADELHSFYTQDITSARWSRDKIRLPAGGDPHRTTSYLSSVTILDRRGKPMAGLPVSVSASTLTEIQVAGASCLVGPGHSAALVTNALGRVVIATPADSLLPATLRVDAAGLANGAVIQPATGVHDYLAGTGTLHSQNGLFTEAALRAAKIVKNGDLVPVIVNGCRNIFRRAEGAALRSRVDVGTGPAREIHGFAAGGALGGGRAGYHEFDRPEDFTAYLDAIRDLPNYGGVWTDFANWSGDVWQGIKNGTIQVVDVLVGAITKIFIKIGDAVVELLDLVIDTVESAVRAVEALFRRGVDTIGEVVDWLKALFNFKDIWDTKKALQDGAGTILSYGAATVAHFGHVADGWFASKEKQVKDHFNDLKKQYAGRPLGDAANQIPALTDAAGHSLTESALRDDPQANWLLNQALSAPALKAFADADAAGLTVLSGSPIPAAWESFMRKLTEADIGPTFLEILGDLEVVVTKVVSPDDPAGASKASMVALIEILERLTHAALRALDLIHKSAVTLVETVAAGLQGLLNHELPLGPVNTFYRWIQTQNGIKNPENLTVGGLGFLLAGFVTSTSHKLAFGVDTVPFPDGFPAIPAPPWHSSYDPSHQLAPDPAGVAFAMKVLQGVAGFSGLFASFPEAYGDISAAFGEEQGDKGTRLVCAIGATILDTLMFSALTSCPPVTGSTWQREDKTVNGWTYSFLVSVGMVFLNASMIAVDLSGQSNTAFFKNAGNVQTGPVAVGYLAGCYMVFAGMAIHDDGVNAYSAAAIQLSAVPSIFQAVRFKVGDGDRYYKHRVGLVAGVDTAAMWTSTMMVIVAALTPAPSISNRQKLPTGNVGKEYKAKIAASGGEKTYNYPLKNFEVLSGALPAGIRLDGDGQLLGTPTEPGKSTFAVQCTDSFGPNQYSNKAELSIEIGL
ncbi:putative Ig domain-containing protein [Pseudofrankia saprophytica]|uniref:putative Ig domain-containing protein n=1 Tax=Pseudofrankia saprophytica TaxID=298655 RepID=UPI000234B102|nr:putative Ig domain-containing protein [Pseudofrankia saprophytica]